VFYGSSTLTMWKELAQDLNSPRILNLGFGGSTLEACVHFFERLVVPVKPCSLILYAGDNDLGDGRSPAELLGYFRSFVLKKERYLGKIDFGFISIKPSPARLSIVDRIRRTNDLIRAEIEMLRQGYFVDVFEAMLDAKRQPRRELFLEDGLHMSRAGYELWITLLSAFRHRIFTEDCPASKDGSVRLTQSAARIPQMVQPKPES
jgi:lysophospholipase L1-like esterase